MSTTDPTRWRLIVDEGDHQRQYLSEVDSARRPPTTAEKHFLGLPTVKLPSLQIPHNFQQSVRNGFRFYQNLQLNNGHWGCGYGGPGLLLAGIVIAIYITETEISPEWKAEIIRFLSNTVNEDGGWGSHSAGASTVFATTLLCYIANPRAPTEPFAHQQGACPLTRPR
ncbi:hypothetical protein BDV25DRAFT_135443 [Aspergillus avenaceus]|uniref:Terpenoid cyclases/protein prenyltransferase alpha-alpha toroid n=1 Tax=Aspergillus avenaceus TaxID=36643 RepID=A0A5N6U892_ASPAV|nr:hypothetical protein BDV25DRAFT_135443 [Aspergillus avenaceus]